MLEKTYILSLLFHGRAKARAEPDSMMLLGAVSFTLVWSQAKNPATVPVDRLGEEWWRVRHERSVAITKGGHYDLIFIGDSITQRWEEDGKSVWSKYFAHRLVANFGFAGDHTQHLLWRMEHGEILGLHPKVAVLLIGTNNIGYGSANPSQTAEGVIEVVNRLRANMPSTKILLLGLFPRMSVEHPWRVAVDRVTAGYASIADGSHVIFMDIGRHFKSRDGQLWRALMPDQLHLSEAGYEIWAKAMEPSLKKFLGES